MAFDIHLNGFVSTVGLAGYTQGSGSLSLVVGGGATLTAKLAAESQPSISSSNPLRLVIHADDANWLVFRATALSGDTLAGAVVEGTDQNFLVGTPVFCDLTSAQVRAIETAITSAQTTANAAQPGSASLTSLASATYPTGSILGGQGTAVPKPITIGAGLTLSGSTLSATGGGSGTSAVTSVAGRTGAIVLSASDISGLGSAATQSTSTFCQAANNLSDLSNASIARTNLGLGSIATMPAATFATQTALLSVQSTASSALTLASAAAPAAGSSAITTVGTVASGTWQGAPIAPGPPTRRQSVLKGTSPAGATHSRTATARHSAAASMAAVTSTIFKPIGRTDMSITAANRAIRPRKSRPGCSLCRQCTATPSSSGRDETTTPIRRKS